MELNFYTLYCYHLCGYKIKNREMKLKLKPLLLYFLRWHPVLLFWIIIQCFHHKITAFPNKSSSSIKFYTRSSKPYTIKTMFYLYFDKVVKQSNQSTMYYFIEMAIEIKCQITLTNSTRKQLIATTRRSTGLREQTWRRRGVAYCITSRA